MSPWFTETLFPLLLAILPGGIWMAFWLFAVNWKKLWPVLAEGAWAPVVLLGLISALVWSRVLPSSCNCIGVTIQNFWWQLGSVSALIGVALFSGWLQGQWHTEPPEIAIEPPAHADHGHDHHGHH